MTHDDRRFTVHAPAVLSDDTPVTLTLHQQPSEALHDALHDLGFWASGYADIRNGKVGKLRAALDAISALNGRAYKLEVSRSHVLTPLPDATDFAHALGQNTGSATWSGGVSLIRGARVHLEEGRILAWGEATLTVAA
jgi:hypothetical protein